MPRVRIVHWKDYEARPLIDACRKAGWEPEFEADPMGGAIARGIRKNPPDAIAIDLSRLPAHGREMAVWLRGHKKLRHIPIVFVNGEPLKVDRIRTVLPDAIYTDTKGLGEALNNARATENVVVPPQMEERFAAKTVAEKLGITTGLKVSVVDAPRDYSAVVGELPAGAEFREDPRTILQMTLWFIYDLQVLAGSLPKMRAIAGRTKLWILWRKGSINGVGQNAVRNAALEAGLVDYKVCALNGNWSGILFARKKE